MNQHAESEKAKISVFHFSYWYGAQKALSDVTLQVLPNELFTIIGPAKSGKTTFLRCLNRMNDSCKDTTFTGEMRIDNQSIYAPGTNVAELRRKLGMVFAVPVALPKSIYENLAIGPRMRGIRRKQKLDSLVESSLKSAYLWNEVKDRLKTSAKNLSGGQQQRLCLARAIALEPEVLLLDEPCSGLDPISTHSIEEALLKLKAKHTVILVTNITSQAARVGDRTAFFLMGELIECGQTKELFTRPKKQKTSDYITGKFG